MGGRGEERWINHGDFIRGLQIQETFFKLLFAFIHQGLRMQIFSTRTSLFRRVVNQGRFEQVHAVYYGLIQTIWFISTGEIK